MGSEHKRPGGRWTALAAAWMLALGCQSGEVRHCPDEHESMLSDGTVQIQQYRSLSDPTAGGVLSGPAPEGGDRPTKLVLLLDYSGSMFGGYGRQAAEGCDSCRAGLTAAGRPTRSQQPFYYELPVFRNLLARWLDAATPAGSGMELEVLLFNARLWRLGEDRVEPYEGPSQLSFPRPVGTASEDQIADWLRRIPGSPYDVHADAPNSTESRRALEAIVAAVEDEAVVWLVTDNIVDQGGAIVSAEDARRNLEFYDALRSEPRVQMIAAYPLHLSDGCSWMCGTSLFVYGMYVARTERPGSAEFHRLGGTTADGGGPTEKGLLWNRSLTGVAAEHSGRASSVDGVDLAGVPLRLKPVDTEVLSFDFALHRGQALRCQSAEFGQKVTCVIRATVRNTLRHQTVDSAKLSFSNQAMLPRKTDQQRRLPWASAVCAGDMRPIAWRLDGGDSRGGDEPIQIGPLAPLASTVVDVIFELPTIHVDTRSRRHIFDVALTDKILLDGRVTAEMRDIRTSLFIDTGGLGEVYGAPELPGIFRGQEQGRIEAVYPAGAVVGNNGQLLGLVVLVGGGGLAALLILGVMRFQRIHLTVLVDGVEHLKVSMPRLSLRSLEIDGSTKAHLVRGWGSSYKLRPRAGCKLRKSGVNWRLVPPDGGEEINLSIRRGWGGSGKRQPGKAQHDDGW